MPFERPRQMAAWSLGSRGGGEQTHFAPVKEGVERWERVRKRYWGQVWEGSWVLVLLLRSFFTDRTKSHDIGSEGFTSA